MTGANRKMNTNIMNSNIITWKVAFKFAQSIHNNRFHVFTFCPRAHRRERTAANASSSTNTAGQHEFRIQIVSAFQVVRIQIGFVFGVNSVTYEMFYKLLKHTRFL